MKNPMMKSVLVLSLFALISGLLLGLFYQITQLTDEEKEARVVAKLQTAYEMTELEKIDFQSTHAETRAHVSYFYSAKSVKNGRGLEVLVTNGKGYGGDIELYVIIQDGQIVALKVGVNKETPGTGDRAFQLANLNQYIGVDLISVKQFAFLGESGVDVLTGATYTSKGILDAVNVAVSCYLEYKGGEL